MCTLLNQLIAMCGPTCGRHVWNYVCVFLHVSFLHGTSYSSGSVFYTHFLQLSTAWVSSPPRSFFTRMFFYKIIFLQSEFLSSDPFTTDRFFTLEFFTQCTFFLPHSGFLQNTLPLGCSFPTFMLLRKSSTTVSPLKYHIGHIKSGQYTYIPHVSRHKGPVVEGLQNVILSITTPLWWNHS